ncbi:unnamed protein product [Mucor hiemalis]
MTERENQEPEQSPGTETEATTVRTQAAFVNKLYKMLEDLSIQNLISWSEKGDLFSVSNPTAFSKSVLPQYFKHNNWQSFVRQLNMYGFHKVNDMIHSNLTSDSQTWEFKHPHFRRGEIEDLQNIKRKSTKSSFSSLPSRLPGATRLPLDNDEDIYGPLYKHILHIEDRLHHVTRSYEILKNETNSLRTILSKQQTTFGKFTTLMGNVLNESTNIGLSETKRLNIISKLNEIQSAYPPPTNSSENSSPSTPNQFHGYKSEDDNNSVGSRRSSFIKHPVSPNAPRSLEQFLLSQQHHQYQNPSRSARSADIRQHYDSQSCTPPATSIYSSPSTSTTVTNRRMGFGKESHLLNPEPSVNHDYGNNYSLDKYIKKRRTD